MKGLSTTAHSDIPVMYHQAGGVAAAEAGGTAPSGARRPTAQRQASSVYEWRTRLAGICRNCDVSSADWEKRSSFWEAAGVEVKAASPSSHHNLCTEVAGFVLAEQPA